MDYVNGQFVILNYCAVAVLLNRIGLDFYRNMRWVYPPIFILERGIFDGLSQQQLSIANRITSQDQFHSYRNEWHERVYCTDEGQSYIICTFENKISTSEYHGLFLGSL